MNKTPSPTLACLRALPNSAKTARLRFLEEVLFRNLRNNFHVINEGINYELEFLEKLALGNYNENRPIVFKEILNKKCTLFIKATKKLSGPRLIFATEKYKRAKSLVLSRDRSKYFFYLEVQSLIQKTQKTGTVEKLFLWTLVVHYCCELKGADQSNNIAFLFILIS